jgi:UDP-glucose 4-epimerase
MRLLVTGGAGYVGSVVVEALVAADHRVVVFDNLSQGHLGAVDPAATLVVGDLLDRAAVDAVIERHRPEAVLHFAARTIVPESIAKPLFYLSQNVVGSLNLFDSMMSQGVRRLVFSSTAGLFSGAATAEPIQEDHPIMPGSPYGESKYIVERMLHCLATTSDFRYVALRYFNAAGATLQCGEDHDPETHLIPLTLQVAQGRRERMTICGTDYPTPDGTCVRDYIHVDDLAQAHLLALRALDHRSGVYNLGNGLGFSVRQVVEAARKITGHPIPTQAAPRRPGDPPKLVASSERIRRELDWQPKFPQLEQIIDSAWQWHRQHPDGYADARCVEPEGPGGPPDE